MTSNNSSGPHLRHLRQVHHRHHWSSLDGTQSHWSLTDLFEVVYCIVINLQPTEKKLKPGVESQKQFLRFEV